MARPLFFLLFSAPGRGLHCSRVGRWLQDPGTRHDWEDSFPRSLLAGLPASGLLLLLRVLGQLPSGPQKGSSTQLKTRPLILSWLHRGVTWGALGQPSRRSQQQMGPGQLAFKATQEFCRAAAAGRPRPVVSGPTRPPAGPCLGCALPSPAQPNFPSPQSVRSPRLCALAAPTPQRCPLRARSPAVSIPGPLLLPPSATSLARDPPRSGSESQHPALPLSSPAQCRDLVTYELAAPTWFGPVLAGLCAMHEGPVVVFAEHRCPSQMPRLTRIPEVRELFPPGLASPTPPHTASPRTARRAPGPDPQDTLPARPSRGQWQRQGTSWAPGWCARPFVLGGSLP